MGVSISAQGCVTLKMNTLSGTSTQRTMNLKGSETMMFSSKQAAKQLGIPYRQFKGACRKLGMRPHLERGGVLFWDVFQIEEMQKMIRKEQHG